jgi:D-3-phosphoglycerate dehydrogenase
LHLSLSGERLLPEHRILVSDKLSERGLAVLRAVKGFAVDVRPGLGEAELCEAIGDYEALVIRSGTRVTERVIARAARLRVIGRAGIGVDNVDIEAASARGVVVMNTPGGNTITTAEHAVAMLLALARNIPGAAASTRHGEWSKSRFMGTELFGKTLGLIGLGRIGSVVAQRMNAFKMKVIAADPYISHDRASELGVELVELDALLAAADFISLHVPLTEQTRGVLDAEALARAKRGVRIVNCARGGLVDEAALVEALASGQVAGAALDVLSVEPPERGSALLADERVIVTPHLGASTREAQENVAVDVAEQVRDYLLRGVIRNAINVPSIAVEIQEKVRPYVALAEMLGAFLAQVSDGAPKEVAVSCQGDLVGPNEEIIATSALKGVLEPTVKDVNIVNAPVLARERGVRLTETRLGAEDYTNFVSVRLTTEKEVRTAGGAVLRRSDVRLISFDEYFLEARPTPTMLVVINRDRPGVIGRIGTILGEHGINIADMHLSCLVKAQTAASIYNIDGEVGAEAMRAIRALPMVLDARVIYLGPGVTREAGGD